MVQKFQQRGFTLVELIMVIVIMGVIGGIVSAFMKRPIDAYFDTARRAALTDIADTAVRRIARDIHKALPNSIRMVSANQCVTFIPTRTGGRYRSDDTVAGLDFSTADSGFNMLGANSTMPADQQIRAGDLIAVYNLGIPGSEAYAGENTSVVTSLGNEAAVLPGTGIETPIVIAVAGKQFPFESPSHRFQVIPLDEKVVTYGCSGTNLYRSVSTAYPLVLPAACPTSGQILATNTTCSFDYSGSDLRRNALVRITLTVSSQGESVNLYHEVHVNNTP